MADQNPLPPHDPAEGRVKQIMETGPAKPGDTLEPEGPPLLENADAPVETPSVADAPVDTERLPDDLAADPETDQAVDDIVKHDSDEVLKIQDETAAEPITQKSGGHFHRLRRFWREWWSSPKKRWGTIAVVVVVLAALFIVPWTRYNILGLVLKQQVSVLAVDSKTGAPVSGALVTIDGVSAQTEANGKASLRVHAGSYTLTVSKKYYAGFSSNELVTLSASHNSYRTSLKALGRQVKVKVANKLTGQPLADVVIRASGATAKTAKDGTATLVIASGATTQPATVSLGGYNTASVSVQASDDLAKNTFSLTPSGKLYFLSNLSGTIDVVKTNLDGTDRQTVLSGTGNEDANTTSLLASRDWKYLALLSKRAGTNATLYLIDTTNGDKLTTIDQGNATFTLVGWSGDRFIYEVSRNTISDWQPNQEALKSFDPTTGQTLLLDQTQASGTSQTDFIKQTFASPYLIGSQVVYAKDWNASYYSTTGLSGKAAELDTIGADGSGHRVIKTFALASGAQTTYIGITTQLYEPDGLYVQFNDGNQENFYDYEDGKLSSNTSLTDQTFYQTPYPTYLLSPSGNQTFWSEQRDGKNTLLVGDDDAKNPKQIATLSDYNTYGWYTDNYLLVSKNSSELYILPASGGMPLKVTDYYKPAITYNGYGGGYGGL